MKTISTCLPLLAALLCSSSPIVLADREPRDERSDGVPRFSPREETERLRNRSELGSERMTITNDYIRRRIDWLKVRDPVHARTHALFESYFAAGYDPLLLDTWMDGLSDGAVVVGMPGELVLSYYGDPLFINQVDFNGVAAVEWGVRLLPDRIEKVTVAGGKVVRVRN